MADYTLKHTDPANGVFIVHDNTADGPQTPASSAFYVNPITGVSAVSANTSLVFIGKSLAEYGEVVQNNMLYLTEHFANKTRPVKPSQGQIWYKNADYTDPANPTDPTRKGLYIWFGTAWGAIMVTDGGTLDLDMHGYRIINLDDPVNPTDALNLQFADGRYLKLTGGTVNGAVNFNTGPYIFGADVVANVTATPTQPLNITNKKYVDDQDQILKTELTEMINDVDNQLGLYVLKSGDTMTGALTFAPNASLTIEETGTGTISLGKRRAQNMASPTQNLDGANKIYVDTAITTAIANIPPAPEPTPDGVVYAGTLNPTDGVLKLLRTQGLPDVIVSGEFAPFNHTHDASTINVDTDITYPQSFLALAAKDGTIAEPTDTLQNVIRAIDQAVTDVSRPTHRQLFVQTVAGNTSFTLETLNGYPVDEAKLMVFKNGVKQYATERGSASMLFTGNIGILDGPIVNNGSYNFGLNVNGTQYTVPIVASDLSFYDLADLAITYIEANNIPCSVQLEQFMDSIYLHFKSNTTGVGSVVTLTAGTLLANIDTYDKVINRGTVTTTYGYSEVGLPGEESVRFTFTTAPAIGEVIEALITS